MAQHLRVTTDITRFLPDGDDDSGVRLARQLATGELSRTMVLLVTGAGPERVAEVSRRFERALRAHPDVGPRLARLEGGPPEGVEQALWELYRPRRFAFAAADAEAARRAVSDAGLDAAVASLRRKLATPMSGLLTRVAPEDPLLCLPRLFERMQGARGAGLAVVDGRFVTDDGRAAVLFCATRAASTDSSVQRPFLAGVDDAFRAVDTHFGGGLRLLRSGSNRFALAAEDAIRRDVKRVTIGSLSAVTLLFLTLFGSLRLVLLTLPIVASGFVCGAAVCAWWFGDVHAMTLAFGASMIGVSIDYAIHFHVHSVLAPAPGGPRTTLAALWPGLALGAATTVVGFVALVVSSFPGLQEMAVFAACGITGALFATRLFLPGLASRAPATRSCRRLATVLGRLVDGRADRSRRWLALPAVLVALVCAAGLPRARWSDDISELNRLDAELLAEEETVRERVVRFEQRRLVVAAGADEQAALEVDDRAAAVLRQARSDGLIAGFRSAATLLPSARRQREVDAVLRGDETLWPRCREALRAAGFQPGAFTPFRDALQESPPEPLTYDELVASPLAPLVRPFRVRLAGAGDGDSPVVGFVSFLHGIEDAEELGVRLAAVGARLVDIEATLAGAYAASRERMASLLLLGLGAIVLLVALRHAGAGGRTGVVRPTTTACAPAFLAAAGTVAGLALLGEPLTMLSLVALLMVVSMGVDYGVFLAERHAVGPALAATRLAITVAATSTMLGFGLLAVSDQPALRGIGLTAGLGVLLSAVLATTIHSLTHLPRTHRLTS